LITGGGIYQHMQQVTLFHNYALHQKNVTDIYTKN